MHLRVTTDDSGIGLGNEMKLPIEDIELGLGQ